MLKRKDPVATKFECATCKKLQEMKSDRLPMGWKRKAAETFCGDCWRKAHILRAVSMPVASPLARVDGEGKEVACTWEELRKALRPMWRETTQASNWMITQIYTRDAKRTAESEAKIPPMPKLYLYPDARVLFPSLPPQSVASLEQTISRKYRRIRYDLIWTAAVSLPTFRYPVPFPVHNQSWSAQLLEGRPVVRLRIGAGWCTLRLKAGPQFARQLGQFGQIARGDAERGELAVYEKGSAIMVKMVAWLPRSLHADKREGTLFVSTRKDSLLVAVNGKDEKLWTYNADQLRRWQREHAAHLQRWSEDAKWENRPVPNFAARRTAAVEKFHDRMASATHEIAAQLAGYARRRRFATVRYDDSEHGFCISFPWHRLRSLIIEKLDEAGIQLEIASADADEKSPEPLAQA